VASQKRNNGAMNKKLAVRLIIDLTMTVLLICAYAYRIIGDTAHEWIGISVFALFITHNTINWRWYKNIFKGKYTLRRTITTIVNIILVFTMATLIITGLMHSRAVLAFLHLPGGMVLRLVHTTAAYWGLPLIGIHLGLNWGMIINGIRKMAGITQKSRPGVIIARVLAFLFAAFGVWASFDRDIFSKLFQGFSFDYWDEKRPAIIFFAAMLSIMGIYVFVTYYTLKLLGKKRRQE
jgi:hypothetical protein